MDFGISLSPLLEDITTNKDDISLSPKQQHPSSIDPTSPPYHSGSTLPPRTQIVLGAELNDDAVIDDVISLVDGGNIDFSVKIKEMLLRESKMVDVEDYIQWARSLVDAPVVIEQRPSPIHTLVPVKMRNAYLKKQNLERAIEDYISEYSVCKCEPCKNGGTLVLVDGACTCMCSSYFKGIACQVPKSTLIKVVTDGGWSCWSAWSTCINGESTRTRQCNNPAPEQGGRPCQGESIEKRSCEEVK